MFAYCEICLCLDNRISQTKQSSYSYAQQGSTNYSSHNGDAQYNASYQANYEYNNDDPDISIGSLRSHDIMEHEEMYHFGTNMKRSASNRSANRIPSRPSSVRSNRSSIRNGDLEEYDIITAGNTLFNLCVLCKKKLFDFLILSV